jgi:predicted esterase
MKLGTVAERTLLIAGWTSAVFGCGEPAERTASSAGAGPRSVVGSAGLGAAGLGSAGVPERSSGGAAGASSSEAGRMSVASGASGLGGVVASGGSSGAAGGAVATAGGGGASGLGGQGGSLGRAGQGAVGNGETGGMAGGQAGSGALAGAAGSSAGCPALESSERSISFGTLLNADGVTCAARQLATSLANAGASGWRAKGDQHRKYHFADANADEPYRIYVPMTWNGTAELPLALFLHGSGSDENTYVDQNNGQLLKLAEQHGYLLVAPLGADGAYGNFLRLSSPFGKPDEAAKLMAAVTADSERTNELSERDVINVLELVLAEYPVDRGALFLFGHSMGSGGTWYLGGKYSTYFRGLAPMSGPFVQEDGYPWSNLTETPLFVTEGTQAPSVDGSRTLRDWLKANGFKAEYEEVDADHGGMIPLVLPDIFEFFDSAR